MAGDTPLPVHTSARSVPIACGADAHYRPFFIAGMLTVLTVGAAWGVLLLTKIAGAESFVGVTVHEVNAHGHAQVMGWVGLFIMGFAYQAFPKMWGARLVAPKLAIVVFALVLGSIAARSVAMYTHASDWAVPLHTLGSIAQLVGIGVFVTQIAATFAHVGRRLSPSTGFIFAALVFMLLQAAMSVWHADRLLNAGDRGVLLYQISVYQAPLRDLQIHGMMMLMIFGVGLKLFPPLFGFWPVPAARAWAALGLLLGAILLEVTLFVVFRTTGDRRYAALMLLAWLMLPAGAGLLVWSWRPWAATHATRDRSVKFLLAAFFWLFVSFAMLLALPVYLALSGTEFSHAYHGAVRHAVTVGFVSMTIMAMAAKVVPTLNGVRTRTLSALWGPFLLVNAGCALRVSLQIATDWTPGAFPLVGVSGVLELAGLAWWAAHLAGVMLGARGKPRSVPARSEAMPS